MRKYSVRDRPYRPDRREGRYQDRERNISPYCPTQGITAIDLYMTLRVTLGTSISMGTGNNERAIWGNIAL